MLDIYLTMVDLLLSPIIVTDVQALRSSTDQEWIHVKKLSLFLKSERPRSTDLESSLILRS